MEHGPGIFKQILWIIIRPKALFEKSKEKPSLLIPILLMIVAGIIAGVFASRTTGSINYSDLQNIPPDQAAQLDQLMKNPIMAVLTGIIGAITVIIKNIAGLFIKALIMWGLVYIVGGRGSYMQSVNVVGLSWFPLFIRDLIQIFAGVSTNINQQLSAVNTADISFMNFIQMSFNQQGFLFILWNMVLLTLGYSVVFNISKVKTSIISAIYWIAGFLLSTGIGWIILQNTARLTNFMS